MRGSIKLYIWVEATLRLARRATHAIQTKRLWQTDFVHIDPERDGDVVTGCCQRPDSHKPISQRKALGRDAP